MSKSIYLFKINDNFLSLKRENNLEIILDIFLKCKKSDFYKEQFNLIIDDLEIEIIKNNIIKNFEFRNHFFIENNQLIIDNTFKEKKEIIEFYPNYLKIEIEEDNSLFLDFLSLYFIDLIAIELREEKIYPLHLVKSTILV